MWNEVQWSDLKCRVFTIAELNVRYFSKSKVSSGDNLCPTPEQWHPTYPALFHVGHTLPHPPSSSPSPTIILTLATLSPTLPSLIRAPPPYNVATVGGAACSVTAFYGRQQSFASGFQVCGYPQRETPSVCLSVCVCLCIVYCIVCLWLWQYYLTL